MILRSGKRLIANQLKTKFNKLVKFPFLHNKFQYISKISRWYLTLIGGWPINRIHIVMKFCFKLNTDWLGVNIFCRITMFMNSSIRSRPLRCDSKHIQTLGNTYWSTENTDLWRRLMIACECYYKRCCSEIDDSTRGR